MPFKRTRPELQLKPDVKEQLKRISKSRSEKASRVERAKMLLNYCEGVSVNSIARQLSTNRPKVDRCIDKALQIGAIAALDDLPRAGKPPKITPEAKSMQETQRTGLCIRTLDQPIIGRTCAHSLH